MKSDFEEWFVAQHGPRITSMEKYSDDQLRELVQHGRMADQELASRNLWDADKKSALYAWQARDKLINTQ